MFSCVDATDATSLLKKRSRADSVNVNDIKSRSSGGAVQVSHEAAQLGL